PDQSAMKIPHPASHDPNRACPALPPQTRSGIALRMHSCTYVRSMLSRALGGRVRGQLHRFAWYLYGYMEMGHAQANHGGTSDTCVRNGKVDDESRLWDKVGVVVVVVFGLVLTLFSYCSWVCTCIAELKKRDIKDMGHEDPTHMACETYPAWRD